MGTKLQENSGIPRQRNIVAMTPSKQSGRTSTSSYNETVKLLHLTSLGLGAQSRTGV